MFLYENGVDIWGFVISQEGIKMDLDTIKAIVEWTSPRNIYEVRRFHGLSRFIENLLEIS